MNINTPNTNLLLDYNEKRYTLICLHKFTKQFKTYPYHYKFYTDYSNWMFLQGKYSYYIVYIKQ